MGHNPWRLALELDPRRKPTRGSEADLVAALARGADLRVYTEWSYEEHITPYDKVSDPTGKDGLIEEIIDFRQVYVVEGRHAAGVTTLRQPMTPGEGWNGPRPRMAYFMYTSQAHQACANLMLDDAPPTEKPGSRRVIPRRDDMPKMSEEVVFDEGTLGPTRNFIYDMEVYRYFVADEWTEVLAHDEQGKVIRGDWSAIRAAQESGRELKVALRDVSLRAGDAKHHGASHEVFTLLGSTMNHLGKRWFEAQTHPFVRVRPNIPMRYETGNWDVAWAFVRTDGWAALRVLDPYTRKFSDSQTRLAMRWFAR